MLQFMSRMLCVIFLFTLAYGQSCASRDNFTPCNDITDRETCLTSKDTRTGSPSGQNIYNAECVWCPDGPCTGNNANRCEPGNWLSVQPNQLSAIETCLAVSTYLGCYVDDGNRDFCCGPKQYGYDAESCSVACAEYNYFALQDGGVSGRGGWCTCDNTYSTPSNVYTKVSDSECGSDKLGRGWRNAVFQNAGFSCTTGEGALCKTCQPRASRTSNDQCATCNDGYVLDSSTLACIANLCVPNFMDAIDDTCSCGETSSCVAGKYCYTGECREQKCSSRFSNNIFYGAALRGTWDSTARSMSTYFEVPAGVVVQKIKWKKTTDTTLQYTPSNAGPWTLDSTSVLCKTKYVLTQNEDAFFGAGSNFAITNSQMKTFLEVDATQAITETHHAKSYTYTRTIKNVLPVIVNLNTRVLVSCKFTIAGPEDTEFALFLDAQENTAEDNGQVLIQMEIHSRICIDTTVNTNGMTNGVKVKAGSENIKDGTTPTFEWAAVDGVITETVRNTFCVKTLTFGYTPAVITNTQSDPYDITFAFAQQGTDDTFDIVAKIDIVLSDVLGDIDFEGTMIMCKDRALTDCPTQDDQKLFPLGEKFFAKITLSNLVVNAATINCTTFAIEQTHNGETQATRQDMTVDPLEFEEFTPPNSVNTHVCAASLKDPFFHRSRQGLDATLHATVDITYVQGDQQQRRILTLGINNFFEEDIEESAVGVNMEEEDAMYLTKERAPDKKEMSTGFSVLEGDTAKIVQHLEQQAFDTKNSNSSDVYYKVIIAILVALGLMVAYDIVSRRKNAESIPLLEEEQKF